MMDEEAQRAFAMVADAALKAGGMQMLQPVNALMAAARAAATETISKPEKDKADGE